MNITEQEIEDALRTAPRPKPPGELRERLISEIRLPGNGVAASAREKAGDGGLRTGGASGGWLRRWWPVLAPAAASLACAVGITVQQGEIRDLKQSIQAAPQNQDPAETDAATAVVTNVDAASPADVSARTEQEIARLKELVGKLSAEVSGLERMREENERLKAKIGKPSGEFLTTEETDALTKAKERAESIGCVNNMKQLGLAARIWANDNGDLYPTNLLDMTNEMSTPKILHCPGDHAREAATNFPSYTPANCSYEYLAPGGTETEPERVLFRCPIHGSIGLCDGSVQMGVAKTHPEALVERDGKLYYEIPNPPRPSPPAVPIFNDPKQ